MNLEAQARNISDPWPAPQPLLTGTEPEPYPVDALPDGICNAVTEVQGFVQAPVPLVAGSALSALSIAVQSMTDVQRANRLTGPCSLYLLAVAQSGERKTALDRYFTAAINEWQAQQTEAMKPDIAKYKAACTSWELRREAICHKIKDAARKDRVTDSLERDLADLEADQPDRPLIPQIMRGDETPESLAYVLAHEWPSSAIVSSEAGIIFGSHSMGSDSIMRNLALLNVLWDGGEHSIGRRSKESFTVRGARLTVGLQVQAETLRLFFERTGSLARGTGFMARFLIAWPESTQGTRLYREAPDSWPALDEFNSRIYELLLNEPNIENGALSLTAQPLLPDAKAEWIRFHDAIEVELKKGGELFDVRDVASKTADNAARIACLLNVFDRGIGPIGLDAMKSGARIAAWHLSESRRFFHAVMTPPTVQDAIDLQTWMIERAENGLSTRREVQRHVTPSRLRDNVNLSGALRELEEADRIRLFEDGRKKMIEINPALLGGEK